MPKRSREEKLAAYSKGAKRGYRSRKRFVAMNGVEMKNPRSEGIEGSIGDPGGIASVRGLGKPGTVDAAQLDEKEQHNHGLYTFETESQSLHR
jgi:hypothetical protein